MSPAQVTRLPYRLDCRAYYEQLRDLRWPVWLDSGFPRSGAGRHYDVIAADPFATLICDDGITRSEVAGATPRTHDGAPLDALRVLLGEPVSAAPGLVFPGGAIGYLGYDLAREIGHLPSRAGLLGWPDMAVGLYDWVLLVDHDRRRSYFIRQGRDPRPDAHWQTALTRLQAAPSALPAAGPLRGELIERGIPRADYDRGFARIQRYIRDGDCYQVNYAQRFVARVDVDAWHLYQRLRHENPAPYGALLEYPFGQVLSSSPEQFLSLRGRHAATRPIKGTRPRGDTPENDALLRTDLVSSEKDRAENVMIVDLLRNDLGKVCVPGTVDVPGLFELETFATVHHLVSTVSGTLADRYDAVDLIAACFPGGSITGAPKRRAMEIIDELEPVRREVYCGNVIRLGFDGNLDSSITIRTTLMRGDRVYYWAGGGIVADSRCDAEYQESLDKAAAFLQLLG